MLHDGSRNLDQPLQQSACGACCGGETVNPGATKPIGTGRSFLVSGLDCAEEVTILNKVLAADLGGEEHLAFDVINARMTVLDSANSLSDKEILSRVASTGMSAKHWNEDDAATDHAAHFARQKRFTLLSAGFWAAGFGYHLVETGLSGAVRLFSGHGVLPMPLIEVSAFLLAVVFGTWLVVPKAVSAVRRLSPDMNLLMIVAVAGAIALGEFFEAATVAFFFCTVPDSGKLERGPSAQCSRGPSESGTTCCTAAAQ